MKWYYIDSSITDADRRQGPFAIEEIRDLVESGKITDDTLVWHSGEANWKKWAEFPEASEEFSDAPEATLSDDQITEERLKETLNALIKEKLSQRRFVGFIPRAVAFFIDNVILSILGVAILGILSTAGLLDFNAVSEAFGQYLGNPTSAEVADKLLEAPGMTLFFTIWYFVQAIYFIVFGAITSASPGKMALHIHIETSHGARLNWLTSTCRCIASIFTMFTMLFYAIGYLIVLIDPQRRALHDHIARTRVVYNKVLKNNPEN